MVDISSAILYDNLYLIFPQVPKPEEFPDYDRHYPDRIGVQSACIYPDDLLPMFR